MSGEALQGCSGGLPAACGPPKRSARETYEASKSTHESLNSQPGKLSSITCGYAMPGRLLRSIRGAYLRHVALLKEVPARHMRHPKVSTRAAKLSGKLSGVTCGCAISREAPYGCPWGLPAACGPPKRSARETYEAHTTGNSCCEDRSECIFIGYVDFMFRDHIPTAQAMSRNCQGRRTILHSVMANNYATLRTASQS